MVKSKKLISRIIISIAMGFIFAFFMIFVSPRFLFLGNFYSARDMALFTMRYTHIFEMTFFHRFIIGVLIFTIMSLFTSILMNHFFTKITDKEYGKSSTKLFSSFVQKLRFCYTSTNLIAAIKEDLEIKADCAALMIDVQTNLVVYNSSALFVSLPETFAELNAQYGADYIDGLYFLDENLCVTYKKNSTRGILLAVDNLRFFIICRYIKDIEPDVLSELFREFKIHQNRKKTLQKLIRLSNIVQNWNMAAKTQRSFLPQSISDIPMLEIGSFFKPLVNVSGDYYDIIPITTHKTLILTGDVSGKGLAAALIMGVVVNTVKVAENKEDLVGLIRLIDSAIKRLNLMDKYTVLFLGLIDTENMFIKYINASMESPIILTKSPAGHKLKTLDSNCSVIGIIDLENITVMEKPLFRDDLIFITTDGIPETMNAEGVEFGSTDLYYDTLKQLSNNTPQQFLNKIVQAASSYSRNKNFRDDITMVAIKIKG